MPPEADASAAEFHTTTLAVAAAAAAATTNTLDDKRLRLERSPHPYHRRSSDLPESTFSVNVERRASGSQFLNSAAAKRRAAQYEQDGSSSAAAAYSEQLRGDGSAWKKRRKLTSSSDSGTEADDERPLLKALTAPPLRPRKGLKGAKAATEDLSGNLLASPLLTPSLLRDEEYFRTEYIPKLRPKEKGLHKRTEGDEKEVEKIREKYRRRGRAEFGRRIAEAFLLAVIGMIGTRASLMDWKREMLMHLLMVAGVYSSYLLRICWRQLNARSGSIRSWTMPRFYFPAASDPAPVLYPVLIPVLVAVSLASEDWTIVHTNLVLGLCSIPQKAIPFRDFSVQWVLSVLPLLYGTRGLRSGIWAANLEMFTFLQPLHQTLLPCLEFLTTTSLLGTELQLLSTALINLLFFSTSPQNVILKALLWIGGLALFIACRHVLGLAVSLARVPSWRFRRVNSRWFKNSRLLGAIDDTLGGWLSSRVAAGHRVDSSDSDNEHLRKQSKNSQERKSKTFSKELEDFAVVEETPSPSTRTSLDDGGKRGAFPHLNADEPTPQSVRQRRHTLPTAPSALPDFPALRRSATIGLAKLRNQTKSYLSLTSAQAIVLKWLYAAYAYFVVLITILGPIRIYIGALALDGHEPIGWALGYLFGNNPAFRLQVLMWNLERWVCLPPHPPPLDDPDYPFDTLSLGRIDRLRLFTIGPANTRLIISGYCLLSIAAGLTIVFRLSTVADVDTRRKVFHGMMVTMFGPTVFIDPAFIALAFSLILAIFLLLDLFRASQLPPLSRPLTVFLAPYVDGRDHRGPVIVSHIFLLIGCAIPLWLSLGGLGRGTPMLEAGSAFMGWEVPSRDLSMVSGIICVGMGDAAASLVGRRFGRRRWPWSGGKSLEGSAAFAMAVVLGLSAARAWLIFGGWETGQTREGDNGITCWALFVAKAAVAACGASFTEAVLTGANDNVLVPVILWLLVRGLHL